MDELLDLASKLRGWRARLADAEKALVAAEVEKRDAVAQVRELDTQFRALVLTLTTPMVEADE